MPDIVALSLKRFTFTQFVTVPLNVFMGLPLEASIRVKLEFRLQDAPGNKIKIALSVPLFDVNVKLEDIG